MIYLHCVPPVGNFSAGATVPSSLNLPAVVNSERPCDALIVEVTGTSAEMQSPWYIPSCGVNYLQSRENWPSAWKICQDSGQKVVSLHVSPHICQKTVTENCKF